MDWIQSIQLALNYIESRLLDGDLNNESVARQAYASSANFQRVFSITTGLTIADYIRSRRLTLAGAELAASDIKVVDAALKYGYETPESFAKAFARFHSITPSTAKHNPTQLKRFDPIFLRIEIKGGLDLGTKMISNTPQLANSGHGENYYFNAMARHVMNCLGEMQLADYSLFAGITGDVFTQFYRLNENAVRGVGACDYYLGLRGIVSIFNKVGYAAESFSVRDLKSDREGFLKKITAGIDRGVPVIWYHPGMVGIIVGYESDNQTLLYMNGEMKEPDKLVLNDDFYKNKPDTSVYRNHDIDTHGWVVINGKDRDVSLAEIYRDAVRHLPKLLTMKTDDWVFGAEAFRAWANDIESGKISKMELDPIRNPKVPDFFNYEVYVLNMATNSGGGQSFLQTAQELNPDFIFLEEVRKQYRIINYLWNGGYWIKDVHAPEEREEMKRIYGDVSLETLGGAFGCTPETLHDSKKCSAIANQIRKCADCIDEVIRLLTKHLVDNSPSQTAPPA
jgi:AraC-like DNA-binding protein